MDNRTLWQNLHRQLDEAHQRGDTAREIDILRTMLGHAQQWGEKVAEIAVLRLLGNAHQDRDEMQKSHNYRLSAQQIIREIGAACPAETRMLVEGDLGRSFIEFRDWPKAEAHTRAALEQAEARNDERARCVYRMNLALIFSSSGRLQEGRRLGEEVLRAAEALKDHYILALQHLNLGMWTMHSEFKLNESQRHLRTALAHAKLSGRPHLEMRARKLLGESYRWARMLTGRRDYSADAERHLREAIQFAESLGNPSMQAEAERELAELCEFRRQHSAAAKHYQNAIDLWEIVRAGLGYGDAHLAVFESLEHLYHSTTEFLLRQKQLPHAFRTAERFRSRMLLGQIGQERSDTGQWSERGRQELTATLRQYGSGVLEQAGVHVSGSADQTGTLREITVGIRGYERDLRRKPTMEVAPSEAAMPLGDEPADTPAVKHARDRFCELYDAERAYRTDWQAWQSPDVVALEDARRFLGRDDALLSYFVTRAGVVIFALTENDCHFQHLAYPRDKIEADVEVVVIAMRGLQDAILTADWQPGHPWPAPITQPLAELHTGLEKLYALLVAPVLAVVEAKPHWIIVPHGPLHRLPWATLRGSDGYLVERHSVTMLPSVSLGKALLQRRPAATGEAIFFGNPDPDHPNLRLQGAQREVEAAQRALPHGPAPFLGVRATKQEFLRRAGNAWLLHLACHHFFDASAPLLSFLKLAGKDGADFLYALDIAQLSLPAQLVTLSACKSGLCRVATGDEQIGIVQAFLAAGAGSVISTLWSIEDESAAEFFADFYTRAGTMNLSSALAETQRRMIADPRFTLPYFWAPYVLTGRWSDPLVRATGDPHTRETTETHERIVEVEPEAYACQVLPEQPGDKSGTFRFACPCGRPFMALKSLAGQSITCPACREARVIPNPVE